MDSWFSGQRDSSARLLPLEERVTIGARVILEDSGDWFANGYLLRALPH
jgi:hypothetical protein